jgi:hypothetical protein
VALPARITALEGRSAADNSLWTIAVALSKYLTTVNPLAEMPPQK